MADYIYQTPQGVIIPDTAILLNETQTEFKNAFGQTLDVAPTTPQGVLITGETLARAEVVNNNAVVANQINPNLAGGIFLDDLLAFSGMQRTVATPSVVPLVTLAGVAGTVIPAGSQAQTSAGDLFQSVSDITLDSNGDGAVNFQSVQLGPIPCDIAELIVIVSGILGWETVTNATAATLGSATQSDQGARALRSNTLAFNGISLAEAITSALYAVSGVKSLAFRENYTNDEMIIEGVTLVPHSIYVDVDGATDLDVAAALLENKSSGAAWNGETTVSVVEPASGQAYSVKFSRPELVDIRIKVTSPNGNSDDIAAAILAYAAGEIDGLTGFVVGEDISPFEIAAAINSQYPGTFISKVELSLLDPISYSTDVIPITIAQQAYTQLSYILVVTS